LKKSYVYANGQVLCQYDPAEPERYFYIHDRLGSVRLVADSNGTVRNSYTYNPFGEMFATECAETVYNPFKFTGQWWDDEISQYYLRARMYDPVFMRFTSRDPVRGKFNRPMTLHPYLYCGSDPVNKIDLDGRLAFLLGGSFSGNITATDLSSGFTKRRALEGIGAMVGYYSVLLPYMAYVSDRFGAGGTAGAGFVAAWDHNKSFNDRSAWSWGTMQWAAGGGSWASGPAGSITVDIGISNATHVSQLAGRFVEAGGSGTFGNFFTLGGTFSVGVNPDDSFNDIWLGTVSFGGGTTPGGEGHGYVGNAWVQEYNF